MNAEIPAGAQQLREWAQDISSRTHFSPLTQKSWLLLDASGDGIPKIEQNAVAAWLRQLPCPTLGIASDVCTAIAGACDVVLTKREEAVQLIANIRKTPIAASVFVQLLRNIENLELGPALMAESLAYSTLQAGPEYRRWLATHRQTASPENQRGSDSGTAVVSARDGDTLKLELNRPGNRNAMSMEMRDALMEALQLALDDASIKAVEISGRGPCFSVGGDLDEFGTAPDPASAHLVRGLALPGRLLAQCADRVTVKVHGACIGSGIEFPAFAGRIVAGEGAYFQLPELQFGLIPGAGGCVSIPRRIGRQRAAWLVLSGKRIPAQQAHAWKLVDTVS